MLHAIHHPILAKAKAATQRAILVTCVALALSVGLVVAQEPVVVHAAPPAAASRPQDRRPDRERPVNTSSQGSTSATAQHSSNATTSHARPRLVRR